MYFNIFEAKRDQIEKSDVPLTARSLHRKVLNKPINIRLYYSTCTGKNSHSMVWGIGILYWGMGILNGENGEIILLVVTWYLITEFFLFWILIGVWVSTIFIIVLFSLENRINFHQLLPIYFHLIIKWKLEIFTSSAERYNAEHFLQMFIANITAVRFNGTHTCN